MLNILPAAKSTFGTTAVSVTDVARKLRAGTVIVADRYNHDGTVTRVFLVTTDKVKVPALSWHDVRHATNKRPYGQHHVLQTVTFKFDHGILVLPDFVTCSREYCEACDLTATVFTLEA